MAPWQESFWDLFDAEIDGAGAKRRVLTNSFPVPLDDEGSWMMGVCWMNVAFFWGMIVITQGLVNVPFWGV